MAGWLSNDECFTLIQLLDHDISQLRLILIIVRAEYNSVEERLASSNGCQVTTKNFKLVVKGTVVSEGEDGREQIELDFSDDSGVSYYTDDKECPLSYVTLKLDDNEGRSLTAVDKDEKSIILGHRALQSFSLCDTSGW